MSEKKYYLLNGEPYSWSELGFSYKDVYLKKVKNTKHKYRIFLIKNNEEVSLGLKMQPLAFLDKWLITDSI